MYYLIDSDVFITAKNQYYAFDICPDFWHCIIQLHEQRNVVCSVDRVKNELVVGRKTEDLVRWVTNMLPDTFFLPVDADDEVANLYTNIMMWLNKDTQYLEHAIAKFASGADGWLVAYAKVHELTVVTNEQRAPESKKEVKIPDVCDEYGVPTTNIYDMLRSLEVMFGSKIEFE